MPGAPKGQPKSRKKPPLRDEEKHTVPNAKPHVRLQRLSALVLAGAVLLLPYPGGRSAAALVADAPSTPIGWAWRILRSLPPDGLLSFLVLLSLGLLLLSRLRFGKEAWRPLASQCDIPVVLFVVLAFASIGWTVSTHATLTEAARRAGQALFFMLVFQLAGLGYGGVLAVAASASAGLQGLLAVREYLASWSAGDPTWRTFGTFINPNALASYMLTFLPISAALYLTCARQWRVLAGVSVLLQVAGLLLTGSRGGWLAAVAAGAVWLGLSAKSLSRPQWSRLAAMVLICAVLIPAASSPLRVRVSSKAAAQVSSGRFRVLTWLGTIDAVKQKPFLGFGAGTFEFAYPRYAKAGFTRMAHNSYLQFAAELGLLGLALWTWMLGAAFLGVRSPAPNADSSLLKQAAAAGIAGSALHNAVDYGWYLIPTACAFWLCAGLTCGSAAGAVRSRCTAVGMGLLAAAASVLLLLGIGELYAEWADVQRTPAVKAELYRAALKWDPFNPDYRSDYATSLAWSGTQQGVLPNEQGAVERQNFFQALMELGRAVNAEPNRAKLRYRYGLALERAGRLEDALAQYLAAVRLEPNATTPLMAAARLCLQKGDFKTAEEFYRKVTSLEQSPVARVKALEDFGDPNYAEAHLALAEAAFAKGDAETARREALLGVRAADEALLGLRRWKDVQRAAGRYDESQEARLELVKKRLLTIAGKTR